MSRYKVPAGVDASPLPNLTVAPRVCKIESWLNLSRGGYLFAALLGLAVSFAFAHGQFTLPSDRAGDFMQFYSGARLAGTPYLYDEAHIRREQIKATAFYGRALQYVRLPYYASLLSPLAKLPYRTAQIVWQCLSVLAVAGFALLWRDPNRQITLLASCWSLPILMIFLVSQDVSFLLLLLAVAVRLHGRGRLISSGLAMSLLSIKFNLFLLLPLLFWGQRRWKLAAGFALGSAVLIAVSFWAAGGQWPIQMARTLSSQAISPSEFLMPNLRGLLGPVTDRIWPELLVAAVLTVAVYLIVRKSDFGLGFAAVIIGSLLVSHHAGPQDCALLVPALLLISTRVTSNLVQGLVLIMLVPIPYVALVAGRGASAITQLLLISLVLVLFVETYRTRSPADANLLLFSSSGDDLA
jgi:hypothetical protein